jgi:hypothetical protein
MVGDRKLRKNMGEDEVGSKKMGGKALRRPGVKIV